MSNSQRTRHEAIYKIEAIINKFVQDLDSRIEPSLCIGPATPLPLLSRSADRTKRLAVVLRVLELIHQGLVEDLVVTKRDIYYKDPELFGDQRVVDRLVDQLAASLGTTRHALNVSAAAKGLVIGAFVLRRRDTRVVTYDSIQAQLIPTLEEHDVLEIQGVDWILIVEKEATFSALVSAGLMDANQLGRGIMITGKGFPDLSTRAFLRRLSMSHSRESRAPDVLALVDHDPDGLAIMSTYRHGSDTLSHENGDLVVPQLQWLGVKSKDLMDDSHRFETLAGSESERGLLRLSKRDRAKAVAMLKRCAYMPDGSGSEWKQELQTMLMTNIKAEIQLLEGRPEGLLGWLKARLAMHEPAHATEMELLV